MLFRFLESDIPIIHFLDIKKLAENYELPIDPNNKPEIGVGMVYWEYYYNKLVIVVAIVIVISALVIYSFRRNLRYEI